MKSLIDRADNGIEPRSHSFPFQSRHVARRLVALADVDQVVARSTNGKVVAVATDKPVPAGATIERVVAKVAEQNIVAS